MALSIRWLVLILLLLCSVSAQAFENLFYILRSNSSAQMVPPQTAFSILNNHAKSIDLLVPQSYQIDANGIVWGFIDKEILEFSKKNNIKLMALITNAGFDKDKVHEFLAKPNAQKRAVDNLLQICQQNHLYGLQMDFEMVPLSDRDALTQFYRTTADVLHKQGYKISFAVAPVVTANLMPSDFLKKVYENWQGAYDLKALGEFGDFVTVMAYNQHAGKTTPGPTAGIPWDNAVIQFILTMIPAQKVSLGVPLYSEYWSTTPNLDDPLKKVEAHAIGLSYEKALFLIKKFNASIIWDSNQKTNYAMYEHNWLNEYIYLEDAKSFQEKLNLAKQYNIRGISAFCIGIEDPAVWNQLEQKH